MAELRIPDFTTQQMIKLWADHQGEKPDAPEDYLVNVSHLCKVMDRWTATNEAFRLLVGSRLADESLRQELSSREEVSDD